MQILTSSSVEAANLANNHSADYGDVSLSDTIKYLNEAGISNFIGTNTAIRDVNGISVGLVGIDALDETEAAKLENVIGSVKSLGAQLVIVSIHWGEEKATAPNDTQIELAHKAIDAGANLVLGTHPHVLQGIEKYNGKYIAYSLGNFCFGGNNNPADKDTVIYRQTFVSVAPSVPPFCVPPQPTKETAHSAAVSPIAIIFFKFFILHLPFFFARKNRKTSQTDKSERHKNHIKICSVCSNLI